MGYYVRPLKMSKERWLAQNAKRITVLEAQAHKAGDNLVVCLVDNGAFTAAGIGYDDRERDAFMRPDGRPKEWYVASRTSLAQFLN